MNRFYHITVISACALLLATSGGCTRENDGPGPEKKERVVINGRMESTSTDTRAQVVPNAEGLPVRQLPVGIVTVNYTTADPTTDQPDLAAWSGTTADLTRGYFGGPGINPPSVTNGEIEYTNEAGTAIQRVFYEDSGEHYFIRVYYPFLSNDSTRPVSEIVQTPEGAEIVISELDGSQDVMCSNLVWGNIDSVTMAGGSWVASNGQPVTDTNPADTWQTSPVVLSHMFSLFKVTVKAENEKAAVQFGAIDSLVLRLQPVGININMMDMYITPSAELRSYPMVAESGTMPIRFYTIPNGSEDTQSERTPIAGTFDVRDQDGTLVTAASDPVYAGYVMALPASTFRFEAKTADRLWVQANVNFATVSDPFATSIPGAAYEVIITFMESYEILLEVQPIKNWYLDSVFD